MISVLFLIPTLDRGGAENVLVNLVNHMDQSKFKITVQTLFDQDSQKDQLRDGIEYRTFLKHQFHGNSKLQAWIPAGLLYRLIVRKRYDIVVSYLEGPTTHILSGCPYPDSKKVAWVHVEMNSKRHASVGFRNSSEAISAYHCYDKIVFVARTVQKSFESVLEQSFPGACVLYNTIDTDKIVRMSAAVPHQNPFSERELNMISVGRIIDAKGFDRLLRVQKRLKDEGYASHVFILGTGQDRERLETLARENGIADSFTFLGFHENPYMYVSKADLFVCSSRREGFSTAVSEALVLGVPVISTDCSGAKELLGENNEYGVVTKNEEQSLYDGIIRLLENPSLLSHYREQAKKRGNHFQIETTVHAVEEEFVKLFEER